MHERRFTHSKVSRVTLQTRAAGQSPVISGYAALYYDGTPQTEFQLLDDMVERIMPGAFDRAVREDDVRALFNHDPNIVLGRNRSGTLRLTTDVKGLQYAIDPPDTQAGRDVVTSIRRGDVSGSSFAFDATDVKWTQAQGVVVREVWQVLLYDVAPATYPAYESTTSGVRSLPEEENNLREQFEQWQRQHGQRVMSRAELDAIDARCLQVQRDNRRW